MKKSKLLISLVAGLMSLTAIANTPVHRPLIEEYTGTWCGWCIRGFVGMELMRETFGDDFIGIAYHNGDAMQITTNYPNNVTGFPSAFLERNYSIDPLYGFGNVSGGIINDMQQMAAIEVIAGIDVTAKWTSDAKTAIDVNVRFSDTQVRGSGANGINDTGTTSGNGRLIRATSSTSALSTVTYYTYSDGTTGRK